MTPEEAQYAAKQRIEVARQEESTELDLSNLGLSEVPEELGELTHLQELRLDQNRLASFPSVILNLINLSRLYIYANQLIGIPPELGQLTKLTRLSLPNNQIYKLPSELGDLKNLTVLSLSNNQLTELRPELGKLSCLRTLKLRKNKLIALPPEIGDLENLSQLLIDNNELLTLPPELGKLKKLFKLSLENNQLLELIPEIGLLDNLRSLSIGRNTITNLPPSLGRLEKLERLSLDNNEITSLPPEIGKMRSLNKASFFNNRISEVPPEIGDLRNLRTLLLSKNQLTSLPPELGQLSNLFRLSLSYNQLRIIPKELGQIPGLVELSLQENPSLVSPPPEIVNQGTKAVLSYLRDQQSDGERQWLSKLLVVGEGGVGKTSLLRALRGESFEAQQSSTHGIEIRMLDLKHPVEADVTMTLNTWDFGGQEIYHATHQFFLTNRSLFLLSFNARLGYEQGKLVYWLKTIRANAPESPVILVATWADERDADLPLSDLKQQFPQILDLFEVSNKTGDGIANLKKAITQCSANLPLMGEIWPTNWLKFANAVRRSTSKKATPQQFWEAMTKAKISINGQPVLANWLHELGDILFFQEDFDVNDLVILKPQWVTQYISKVLTAEEVIKRNGIFTRQCMDEIWADLTPSLRDFFLRLMERFDLSYRTLENRDISLVVERLPFEPPDYQFHWGKKRQEANCKEISMKFQVSEILPGIPTWFIARQHRFTIDEGERRGIHWRTGVLLRDREGKHLGLVRILRDENTNADYLQLTVRGSVPHNFFDVLREGLELTLRRYPGLKVTRLLPCPDPEDINCTHEFDYANLTRRLELKKPKTLIECPNCLADISVTGILFGLHYTTQDAVIEKIDSLQNSMEQGFTELRELVQREVLREIRVVQNQIESPCPSVFVLRPDDRPFWQKDIGSQRINLQLYCEYPGCLHPVQEGGSYAIDNPQKWLRIMVPHLNRLFDILKYVTPVVGPWISISSPIYSELVKNDLALSKALIDKLPKIKFDDDENSFFDLDHQASNDPSQSGKLHKTSNAAMRTLHEFLKRKDPERTWGRLTRTVTPEGDVLWLCKEHRKEIYPTSL